MAAGLRKVYVVGVGMSKFIKPRGEVDYPGTYIIYYTQHKRLTHACIEFGLEAAVKALNDAKVNYDQVEYAVCGYVYGDSTCGQRCIYQLGMTNVSFYVELIYKHMRNTCTRSFVTQS